MKVKLQSFYNLQWVGSPYYLSSEREFEGCWLVYVGGSSALAG